MDLASYTERAGGEPAASDRPRNDSTATAGSGQDRETTKLNQIIQVGMKYIEVDEQNVEC